ncbi:MAG: sigma-70 family RNA polymerase sigma factor [Planctomycetota bacterium]|nr:sigma-70 family RNA polymerase sigma factor [Planctomycetota bacterium]
MHDDLTNRPEDLGPDSWDPEKLIAEHYLGVWRYLRAIGCPIHLADDLAQETFVAVLRRPFELVSPQSSSAYLRRVAFHLLLEYKRKFGAVGLTDQAEILDRYWTRWAGADASGDRVLDNLAECFQRLSPRAQKSLKMRFEDQASREQIAADLQITENGVKNLQQRAKAQLRQCLEEKLGVIDR